MSIYSGFPLRELESKYNLTLFDLVLTLGTRVAATLRNRKPYLSSTLQALPTWLSRIAPR